MSRHDGLMRTADGDLVLDPDPAPPTHRCREGWTGEDEQGRPIPCLACRPHLMPRVPRHLGDERTGLTTHSPTDHTRRNP